MAVDFTTTPIPCPDCRVNVAKKGKPAKFENKGEVYDQFKGWVTCPTCQGEEEIQVCDDFNTQNPAPMKRTKCDQCHATKGQHELVAKYKELTNA